MVYPDSDYPGGIDSFPDPDTTLDGTPLHSELHLSHNDAIEKLETEGGITPSGSFADVAARLAAIQAGTTGTIAPVNANYSISNPTSVKLLSSGIAIASTTIDKIAGGNLTPPGQIATIPAGFRPASNTNVSAVLIGTATPVRLRVNTSGAVELMLIQGGGVFVTGASVDFNCAWLV